VIDIFALGVTHGLIALALWRLVWREDLNGELAAKPPLDESVGRPKPPLDGGGSEHA
jgi:hypothetical protein